MKQIFTFIFILFFSVANAQTNDNNFRKIVLKENQIGKEFVFGKWNQNGETETRLTYLGKVKSNRKNTYKVMNSTRIWGFSGRATNRILIFNRKNQYLGNYVVTLSTDLPTELKNGVLIFKNTTSDCDKNAISKVDLKNGVPEQIFRECKNGYGDLYTFDRK